MSFVEIKSEGSAGIGVDFDEQKVDQVLEAVNQCHLPGVCVGIAVKGKPVYRKGFGLANIELPLVLTPSIRMRIGSTTKHFTAFTFMRLCEAGRATPEDKIGKYIPELHAASRGVTIRQLMTNTSGLRDVVDIIIQGSGQNGRYISTAEMLDYYAQLSDVSSPPGETWSYNNGTWVALLTVAIERIAGKPVEQVMQEQVFGPVGMTDTILRRWDRDLVPNSASSHLLAPDGKYKFTEITGGIDISGAGAIASTVDDMLLWLANMDDQRVGTAQTWQSMMAPQLLNNGSSCGYGFGLIRSKYRGVDVLHHAGGGLGSNAQMLKVPAAGFDVTVMSNRSDVSGLMYTYKILDACLTGLSDEGEQRPDRVSGTFYSAATRNVVHLLTKADKQFVSVNGQDIPYEWSSGNQLHPAVVGVQLKRTVQIVGPLDGPDHVVLHDFGNYERLYPAVSPSESMAGRIQGLFIHKESRTQVIISQEAEGLIMTLSNPYGEMRSSLELLGEGIVRSWSITGAMPPGGSLVFDADYDLFQFSDGMTAFLPFRRQTKH